MDIDTILSIARDRLNNKYVHRMIRLLGTYYYILSLDNDYRSISNYIWYDLIVDDDILPLYRTIVSLSKDESLSVRLSQSRTLSVILMVLSYTVLNTKNTQWNLYIDNNKDVFLYDGVHTFIPYRNMKPIEPYTSICCYEDMGFHPIERKDISESLSNMDILYLVKHTRRNVIYPSRTTISTFITYTTRKTLSSILPEIICKNERPTYMYDIDFIF